MMPGHDVAFAPGVLLVLQVPFGLADALEDDLLGRLGGDAAEVLRRVVPLPDDVAVLVELLAVDPDITGVRIDGDHGLLGRVRHALVGRHERVGQGVEQGVDADALVSGDLLQRLQKCEPAVLVGVFHDAESFIGAEVFTEAVALGDRPFGRARPCFGAGPQTRTVRVC